MILYPTEIWLVKAAFWCYYYSCLFDSITMSRQLAVVLYLTGILIPITYLTVVGYYLGYCWPVSRNW